MSDLISNKSCEVTYNTPIVRRKKKRIKPKCLTTSKKEENINPKTSKNEYSKRIISPILENSYDLNDNKMIDDMEIEIDNLINKYINIDPSCEDFIIDDYSTIIKPKTKINKNKNIKNKKKIFKKQKYKKQNKKKRRITPQLIKPQKIIINVNQVNYNDDILNEYNLKRDKFRQQYPKKRTIIPMLIDDCDDDNLDNDRDIIINNSLTASISSTIDYSLTNSSEYSSNMREPKKKRKIKPELIGNIDSNEYRKNNNDINDNNKWYLNKNEYKIIDDKTSPMPSIILNEISNDISNTSIASAPDKRINQNYRRKMIVKNIKNKNNKNKNIINKEKITFYFRPIHNKC